jgi:mRNA interferase RelE/StbE
MKVVVYSAKARRELLVLPEEVRLRITQKLERYAMTGAADIKAIANSELYRLRVGDYRVLFAEDRSRIAVSKIGHRSNIY